MCIRDRPSDRKASRIFRRSWSGPRRRYDEADSSSGRSQLIERGRQVADELDSAAPNEIKAMLMTLACRVTIDPDRVEIKMSRHRLGVFLAGRSIGLTKQDQKLTRDPDDVVKLVVPVQLKRVGREMRMLVENSDDQTAADPGLLRIIALSLIHI